MNNISLTSILIGALVIGFLYYYFGVSRMNKIWRTRTIIGAVIGFPVLIYYYGFHFNNPPTTETQ